MAKVRTVFGCRGCGHHLAQWAGRCPGCGAWGSMDQISEGARPGRTATATTSAVRDLGVAGEANGAPVSTGSEGIDRVLGGGIVPGSVLLLAGEPGIGKSTLVLQVVADLARRGIGCLIASGEESREQVAERGRRLGFDGAGLRFVPGRDLAEVTASAQAEHPFLLVVDSIQTLRDPDATGVVGGTGQVRACADALVGLAKSQGIAVLMTGHVTKDGDLAGPRTLEHAVDIVLSFEGDPHNGFRMLAGGKNRFGAEGEMAWFEMTSEGLHETDPGAWLSPGGGEAGTALALPMAGRRALAVEVQALAVPVETGARRQVTGLDPRRFQLVAAVVDRVLEVSLGRCDLYGASPGGVRIDDPGCDLAVAAALASAATGKAPPPGSAFVGEVGLTGRVRGAPGMAQRIAAARARDVGTVFVPTGTTPGEGQVEVTHVAEALSWATGTRGRNTRN